MELQVEGIVYKEVKLLYSIFKARTVYFIKQLGFLGKCNWWNQYDSNSSTINRYIKEILLLANWRVDDSSKLFQEANWYRSIQIKRITVV